MLVLNQTGPRLLHQLSTPGQEVLAASGGTQAQASEATPMQTGVPVHKLAHGLAVVPQVGLVRANSLMDGMYNMRGWLLILLSMMISCRRQRFIRESVNYP